MSYGESLIVAIFESDMVRRGGLTGYRASSEDSEELQVLGLGGAESCSESLGWAEGELVPDGVVSECEGLDGDGVV